MTDKFDRAFDIVLAAEIDPNDPDKVTKDTGGETKYGISKRSHPLVDIANLTLSHAKDIYALEYWHQTRCGDLTWPLCLFVFDAAVNQGAGAATDMLGEAVKATPDRKDRCATFMALRALRYARTTNFDGYGKGWMKRLFKVTLAAQDGVTT